jgi:spermidine/putrescine transport system ATP-binding protein
MALQGNDVTLEGVAMRFGGFTAVQPTSLTIKAGEFFSILGPSGCGKTTILRMVSGFLEPSEGRVRIGGKDMSGLGPNKRPTALIFQSLALFPLMTVWENVAFGLEARGIGKAKRRKRAEELLDLVALDGQADKKPTQLSGGQRQRVAVARALAVEPSVLLLDEPLSALDLKLRQHMRAELKTIQRKTGITFIYITHDQGEALTMSDRVAVMNQGRIEQVSPAAELYDRPSTPFVATFVGEQNVFKGKIVASDGRTGTVEHPLGRFSGIDASGLATGAEAMAFVRPERLHLLRPGATASSMIHATVTRIDLEGPFVNLVLDAAGTELSMHLTNAGSIPQAGSKVHLGFEPDDALILKAGELARE